MIAPPKIDERTAPGIVRDVLRLLPVYVDNWVERGGEDEHADALINVFARYGEIIINRLNRAPEKNFLAFLDLLGVSPLPMQSARVPLTFSPAPGTNESIVVRQGAQVAAAPGKGEQRPVIFETELELVVVPAKLESLVLKDGGHDQYTDFSLLVVPPPESPPVEGSETLSTPAAQPQAGGEAQLIPHALLVGVKTYPVWPTVNTVRLKFILEQNIAAPLDPREVAWELCVPDAQPAIAPDKGTASAQAPETFKTIVLSPLVDETENLTKSGDVVFLNLPQMPSFALEGLSSPWLRCQLLTAITHNATPGGGVVRESQLPSVKTLTIETHIERADLALEQAFFNSQKLDFTKDFLPFGEKPKFGDTLYLANREAFSNPDALVTVRVVLTNPRSLTDSPLPPVEPHGTWLAWEFWDGTDWTTLGTGEAEPNSAEGKRVRFYPEGTVVSQVPGAPFSDRTQAFSETGDVTFRFSKPPAELNLNGTTNYWIRVRIIAGGYGKEAYYEGEPGKHSFALHPATFAPPSIQVTKVDYAVKKEIPLEAILTYNDFVYTRINLQSGSFAPFVPTPIDAALPALYFGFTLPSPAATVATAGTAPLPDKHPLGQGKFPNRSMSVHVSLTASAPGLAYDPTSGPVVGAWEYWNGAKWTKWTVRDNTQGIRRSGLIRFLAPSDFTASQEFGQERYWLRMRQSETEFHPRLHRVLLNTTTAIEGATIENDILGASNGKPRQRFRTTQAPVLEGQQLEVREPTAPPLKEILCIQKTEGPGAILRVKDPVGEGSEFWVRWHERPNFYSSGPRDRHYVLDRMTGEVIFGDDVHGMIPPVLPGNVRMASYRTGGGTAGNKPAQTIKQLKTAIAGIQKVMNWEAAAGGADLEPASALLERGPRGIRHGHRAVAAEDFEDLAMLASREVALAKCVALYDLARDPGTKHRQPGVVSLVIVPRTLDPKPVPDAELIEQVVTFLDAWRVPTADLVVVGPEYVHVDVDVEIAVDDPESASDVELGVKRALDRYLHPLEGGPEGSGWDFGRHPHRSDLFNLIENIPGVSHVRQLSVHSVADRPGAEKTDRSLVCCGVHSVTTTLEE